MRQNQTPWASLAILVGLTGSLNAHAQCADDMGCKGDRICVNSECVAPPNSTEVAPTASTPLKTGSLTEVQDLQLSQAQAKATTGLVLGAGTLLMGAATAATNGSGTAPKVLGGLTLALAGMATPIAAAGGGQARRVGRNNGRTMRASSSNIVGWSGYGASMGLGLAVFAAGLNDAEISNGLILSITALGSLSSLTMALDTYSTIQAVKSDDSSARNDQRNRPAAQLAAAVTHKGATVGIVGRF
jgi:hypothetical protein